jgi:hypothetical protein
MAAVIIKSEPFLQKLWYILANEPSELIGWSSDGTFFVIPDIENVEANVLPKYFRSKHFGSFQRQLNYFNFHKTRIFGGGSCFSHESFHRDTPERVPMIKRKVGTNETTKCTQTLHSLKRAATYPPDRYSQPCLLEGEDPKFRAAEIGRHIRAGRAEFNKLMFREPSAAADILLGPTDICPLFEELTRDNSKRQRHFEPCDYANADEFVYVRQIRQLNKLAAEQKLAEIEASLVAIKEEASLDSTYDGGACDAVRQELVDIEAEVSAIHEETNRGQYGRAGELEGLKAALTEVAAIRAEALETPNAARACLQSREAAAVAVYSGDQQP